MKNSGGGEFISYGVYSAVNDADQKFVVEKIDVDFFMTVVVVFIFTSLQIISYSEYIDIGKMKSIAGLSIYKLFAQATKRSRVIRSQKKRKLPMDDETNKK